ncbi:hypothetical protein Poli38472_013181 [Pythium oligandrum]|uniref:Uncharacterized protein n=1 Tax=Pythium oligandrum TaxID=41045 RepID=A0A8K1F9J7_PYTOL|nr:hypothetical protein Poli38472_013181 [Pythium oligandrum]|eukprot:TMW55290.1 hypothetical protein Poli38472_013181 [Pythium oligandrum]
MDASSEAWRPSTVPTYLSGTLDAAGRFVHTQCDQALFKAEYLRSNKASGHKNLRCFPHCCGGHNPKSFCGAGLVVECAYPRAQVALGCFEEVQKNAPLVLSPDSSSLVDNSDLPHQIRVGNVYAQQELSQDVKSSENPFGRWFRGVSVVAENALHPRFHLNGNRQSWHYGWQSSRLNCKNLHAFKVYFFQQYEADPTMLECIGEITSSSFRISSSRKARKTVVRSPSGVSDSTLEESKQPATPLSLSASPTSPRLESLDDLSVPSRSASGFGSFFNAHSSSHERGQPNRKRFTRSASLQSDYYSNTPSFVPEGRLYSQSFLGDSYQMPALTSFLKSEPSTPHSSHRPTLTLPIVPSSSPPPSGLTTPVADMMQLRLETPPALSRASSASSLASLLSHDIGPAPVLPIFKRQTSKRKRNRSGDSTGQLGGFHWYSGPLMEDIAPEGEWDRVVQAHLLALAFGLLSSIQSIEGVNEAVVFDADGRLTSFRMTMMTRSGLQPVVVTHPSLKRLCSVLTSVSSQLLKGGFTLDVRARMHELASQGFNSGEAYEAMVDFVYQGVEAQLASLMTKQDEESPSLLVDLFRFCQDQLVDEPWWQQIEVFDDENDDFPSIELFNDYYKAVCDSLACPPFIIPEHVPSTSMTGSWRLVVSNTDDSMFSTKQHVSGRWPSFLWLHRQIRLYVANIFNIIETDNSITMTMENSLVSHRATYHADLGLSEPGVLRPTDHFPYAVNRHNLLIAYRAWRIRGVLDDNGSALAVQRMNWPSIQDCSSTPNTQEPEQEADPASTQVLTRSRVTSYFSMLSPTRLQVRNMVEVSRTDDPKLCAMASGTANDPEMIEYFKTPAAWEFIAQFTMQFERM